ncbi:MAG: Gfo/Idh/MocA family oxidoreductase [Blastocatellia bacterium]|nr:Gfo/Idh/MocA family oxidoreductase [Blastocatellia bacterium]MCX7753577.1 Gfo/Idh/MocA family oxidoreductase [Blastocatellia bacterium]MDW8166871.1 Gfo/Idh/MocA family oxidoreductase [Acidobacteriota bacterium]
MTKIRIGIVGAGHMGQRHAQILARDERVHLAAVYDIQQERARACAQACGAEAVESLEALLERVEAVVIATPNTQHVEATLRALEAERHVFCEKPLATSVEDAHRVLEASRRSRSVVQVGHNRRFAPVYRAVRRLLEEEGFRPHAVHAKMNRGELLVPPWVGDPSVTGGFLYETTIHMLDLLRWWFGEVASVAVHASQHEYSELEDFSILLRFQSGVHATLTSSADASWHFPFERVEIFGAHATIETQELERLIYTPSARASPIRQEFTDLEEEWRWGYVQEDTAFVDAIVRGQPAAVTALDGYRAVQLVDTCYRAARTGEWITLSP